MRKRASITSKADITTPPSAASSTPIPMAAPAKASPGSICLRIAIIIRQFVLIQMVNRVFLIPVLLLHLMKLVALAGFVVEIVHSAVRRFLRQQGKWQVILGVGRKELQRIHGVG